MLLRKLLSSITSLALIAATTAATAIAQTHPTTQPFGQPAVHLPQGKDHLTIKLSRVGPLLLAPGQIDGHDAGWIAVDTGSSSLYIDQGTVEKLNLRTLGKGTAGTGDGPLAAVSMVACGTFALGDPKGDGQIKMDTQLAAAGNFQTMRIVAGAPLAGMVGTDLLAAMPFSIDFRDDTITFHARDHFSPPATQPYPIRMSEGDLPLIQASFDTRPFWCILDTGNTGRFRVRGSALSFEEAFALNHPLLESFSIGAGGMNNEFSTRFNTIHTLGRDWHNVHARLDAGEFSGNLAHITWAGIIGAPAFEDARLTADYRSNQVWIEWRTA